MQRSSPQARYPSPLRYPGGKGKVANFLKLVILQNSLTGVRYLEPYAGGASVALSLLFEEYVSHIHINDLNPGVYAFWKFALEAPDDLCARIMEIPLTIEEWQRQKSVYSAGGSASRDIGFATFFLNRTNRSGIIARGGVIGGNDQQGTWKIDARFNRQALCARIRKISRFSANITITKRDAASLIASAKSDDSFIYLDPPYYLKGAGLYDNFYTDADHRKISRLISAKTGHWVVSYDAAPEILKMYSGCESIRYTLGYSASTVSQGTEVMFFSPGLKIPAVSSPAGINAAEVAKELAQMGTLF